MERGRRKSQQNSRIWVRAQVKLVYPVRNLSDSSKSLDDRQIKGTCRCRQSRFLFPDSSRKDRSDSASRVTIVKRNKTLTIVIPVKIDIIISFPTIFQTLTNVHKRSCHNCSSKAECNNTKGSYNCTCKAGFTGDGQNCSGTSFLFTLDYYSYCQLFCLCRRLQLPLMLQIL